VRIPLVGFWLSTRQIYYRKTYYAILDFIKSLRFY
jgi:hypothetical protein